MRLKALSVSGFRGFPGSHEFDLDADAVVLVGPNGTGKTSFFDALLWVVTGAVPRLGASGGLVVSQFSPTGEARVEVVLSKTEGRSMTLVRRFDTEMHISLETGDESLRGTSAEARLLEELWPDAALSPTPWETLSRVFTRGVYLQQDLVRQFVDADTDQERFSVIGELVGAGRIGELQRQLESGKNTWTRSTNVLAADLVPLRNRWDSLQQRVSRLTEKPADEDEFQAQWRVWLDRVSKFIPQSALSVESPEAARSLDVTLRDLEAAHLREGRRLATLDQLLLLLDDPPASPPNLGELTAAVAEAEAAEATVRTQLEMAQVRAAAERSRLIAQREQAEELRALAQLALRHLEARCPVCEQSYDIVATRERLERLVAADERQDLGVDSSELADLVEQLDASQRLTNDTAAQLRLAERTAATRDGWQEDVARLAAELGLDVGESLGEEAALSAERVRSQNAILRQLRDEGESLALRLARATEATQRVDLSRELANVEAELRDREAALASRNATGDLAAEILVALRESRDEIVVGELGRIEPLLQRIYATIDPHPAFRAVRFLTRTVRGRGRLWTTVDDSTAQVSVEEPGVVLSSSQLNVLALSVFLALNLGVETLPLDVLALDDPLQSLDDVNLLGVVDLLRRVSDRRQVIVSTHDARFGNLLVRKLRPVSPNNRTVRIQLDSWKRQGPAVTQESLPGDPSPLRLAG